MQAAIARDFPWQRAANPLDAEFTQHVSFAKPLCKVYEGQAALHARLLEYIAASRLPSAEGDGRATHSPFCVLGAPGAGKSASLAAWLMGHTEARRT